MRPSAREHVVLSARCTARVSWADNILVRKEVRFCPPLLHSLLLRLWPGHPVPSFRLPCREKSPIFALCGRKGSCERGPALLRNEFRGAAIGQGGVSGSPEPGQNGSERQRFTLLFLAGAKQRGSCWCHRPELDFLTSQAPGDVAKDCGSRKYS